jgi:hypothetical protein
LFIVALIILVTAFVVFVERGQRKITVNYAKRQVGNKIYGGQSSFLPLKLNMSGVIPPIFASSLILFRRRSPAGSPPATRPAGSATSRPLCRPASRSTCCCMPD